MSESPVQNVSAIVAEAPQSLAIPLQYDRPHQYQRALLGLFYWNMPI